jgi:hypothetical protein
VLGCLVRDPVLEHLNLLLLVIDLEGMRCAHEYTGGVRQGWPAV